MMNFQLKNKIFALFVCCVAFNSTAFAELSSAELNKLSNSAGVKVKVDKVISGLRIPWALCFISDDELLINERSGRIKLLNIKTKKIKLVKNAPDVLRGGQGGLLDVAIPPNYKNSKWIYFTYVKEVDFEGATTLARAKLKNNTLVDWQELLVTQSTSDSSQHFGSRIAFDNNSHVYFGIGDRGERTNSQDLSNHAGTIIRLNLDGSIPSDNPFINHEFALPEIWSYGHRNPQGLTYDFKSNRLWEIEHGPRGGDEINLIEKAKNYGWPTISYGKEYWAPLAVGEGTHKKGMEQPVKVYIPSIAPGSLKIYSNNTFPNWQGSLFSGALKLRHLNRVSLDEQANAIKEERLFESLQERIRSITQSINGSIYFATDSGNLYSIIPSQ